ncbi:transposase [Streptomyces smyrnaeus]|uniref:Transposase n=1 Tax=Streptomyces smyrnaeus TaxID=1387713 RepID=A0ABS3XZS4_9ACTN|nr:transposase [Streptomyces smyrnaeus]
MANGTIHHLGTGAQSRELPERFGPWQTIHKRHLLWSAEGTWRAPEVRPVRRRCRSQHRLVHRRRLHQHARSPARHRPSDGSDLDLGLSSLPVHVDTPPSSMGYRRTSTWHRKASGPSQHARWPTDGGETRARHRRRQLPVLRRWATAHACFQEASPVRQAVHIRCLSCCGSAAAARPVRSGGAAVVARVWRRPVRRYRPPTPSVAWLRSTGQCGRVRTRA